MKNTTLKEISTVRQSAWNRDGFFIIPNVLSEKECAMFKEECLDILQTHAKPGATVYIGCAAVSEGFARLAAHPAILDALTPLLPGGVEFMSDKIVYKKPGKAFPTPLHIDAWYWKNTRPKISVWIPFGDTNAENGTLTVVPGSHTRDWSVRKTAGINGEFMNELEGNLLPAAESVLACELQQGSAVVFSDRVLHGSTACQSNNERYAIISTYHAPGNEPFDAQFPARKVLV